MTVPRKSFKKVSTSWIEEVLKYADSGAQFAVVGTKADLDGDRVVADSTGKEICKGKLENALFIETSAKEGTNVNELFTELAQRVVQAKDAKKKAQDASKAGPAKSNTLDLNKKNNVNTTQPKSKRCVLC